MPRDGQCPGRPTMPGNRLCPGASGDRGVTEPKRLFSETPGEPPVSGAHPCPGLCLPWLPESLLDPWLPCPGADYARHRIYGACLCQRLEWPSGQFYSGQPHLMKQLSPVLLCPGLEEAKNGLCLDHSDRGRSPALPGDRIGGRDSSTWKWSLVPSTQATQPNGTMPGVRVSGSSFSFGTGQGGSPHPRRRQPQRPSFRA